MRMQGGLFMNIRPSAAIRQNYNEIAEICKKLENLSTLQKMAKVIWLSWISKRLIVENKC